MNRVVTFLREHDNFLLLTHRRPDGDTLGSAAALCAGLRALGKTAYLYRNREITPRYLPYTEPFFAPEGYCHQTAVAVDTASPSLLCEGWEGTLHLRIDHHPGREGFAHLDYSDPDAAACGEVIDRLLCALDVSLTRDMAEALYIALSTDTGCFRYANTTAQTHRIAAGLLDAGADAHRLDKMLYSKTRARISVETAILAGMEYHANGIVAVASLTQSQRQETGVTEDDLDGLSGLTQGIEGIGVGFLLREDETGWRVSCRTAEPYAANTVCALFGGGGHQRAAGASIEEKLTEQDARRRILDALWDVYPELRNIQ